MSDESKKPDGYFGECWRCDSFVYHTCGKTKLSGLSLADLDIAITRLEADRAVFEKRTDNYGLHRYQTYNQAIVRVRQELKTRLENIPELWK